MNNVNIGDEVVMCDNFMHQCEPLFYPKEGTKGIVVGINRKADTIDVQWPKGTTSGKGRWCCGYDNIEKVTKEEEDMWAPFCDVYAPMNEERISGFNRFLRELSIIYPYGKYRLEVDRTSIELYFSDINRANSNAFKLNVLEIADRFLSPNDVDNLHLVYTDEGFSEDNKVSLIVK